MRPADVRESTSCFGNKIAHAAQGADSVASKLPPQAVNVNFDRIAADLLVPTVQAILQLRARQHGSRPLQQRFQHREFVRGYIYRNTAALDGARYRIKPQLPVLDAGIAAPGGAAQHRANAGGHYVEVKRLDDIIVGAGVQSRDAMLDLIARRENDDGRCIAPPAQLAKYVDSVSMRQPEIEQHHVEDGPLQCAGGAPTVAHPINGESALSQCRLQALRNHRVVLNEQHSHTAVIRRSITESSACRRSAARISR